MYGRIGRLFLVGLIAGLNSSCEQPHIKEEVAAYCDCMKRSRGGDTQKCLDMMEEITIKYEYDPEALEIIQEELQQCNLN